MTWYTPMTGSGGGGPPWPSPGKAPAGGPPVPPSPARGSAGGDSISGGARTSGTGRGIRSGSYLGGAGVTGGSGSYAGGGARGGARNPVVSIHPGSIGIVVPPWVSTTPTAVTSSATARLANSIERAIRLRAPSSSSGAPYGMYSESAMTL